jgi:hypothetical protein
MRSLGNGDAQYCRHHWAQDGRPIADVHDGLLRLRIHPTPGRPTIGYLRRSGGLASEKDFPELHKRA